MKVLLSIKPEYVERIFNGTKKFEYRKAIFKNKAVTQGIVYSTMPVGKIVGEFTIGGILQDEPSALWLETKEHGGVQESFFEAYFRGRKRGYAIRISAPMLYEEPIDPRSADAEFTPPQFFKYIEAEGKVQLPGMQLAF